MKRLIICSVIAVLAVTSGASGVSKEFEPNWDSLQQYECPEWFRDVKFGIFLHYGLNTVPGVDGHYARHMYWQEKPDPVKGTGWTASTPKVYKHHVETYGHPTKFGYKDFLPLWKADKFDALAMARFFKSCGARYVVPVAVHCDNFDNWNSKHHRWNSANMGPRIDFVGEWKKACRQEGLYFGVSSHFNNGHENVFFQGRADTSGPLAGVPYDTQDSRYEDFYHKRTPDGRKILSEYLAPEFLKRHLQLIDDYQPDLLYFDGPLPYQDAGMQIGAHFFNMNLKRHNGRENGVLNLKRGFQKGACTLDIEKGQADRLMDEPWQTDTTINPGWFYLGGVEKPSVVDGDISSRKVDEQSQVRGDGLRMNAAQIVDNMIDIVSKNGNLLLNIGQRADGSIPQIYRDELEKVGHWLKLNGDAIYGTRPWVRYGEGPTQIKTGYDTEPLSPWKAEDIRFTTKGDTLYVIPLAWPDSGVLKVTSLDKTAKEVGQIKSVRLLGYDGRIQWTRDASGLTIKFPDEKPCEFAYVFELKQVRQTNIWESSQANTPIRCAQWEVNDLVYTVKETIAKPFSRQVYAVVTGDEGGQKIPLFYNGNKEWVFRYSSSTVGRKSFVLKSAIKELNGKTGTFIITENKRRGRHGGVVLDKANPQHLFYEDGSHYFNLAFECDWLFALDYGQEDIPKTKHLLSLLNQYAFNQIVMNVYSYDVSWPKDKRLLAHPEHEYGAREDIFPFLGSNSNPDYSSLNIDFFKHFDKVISQMHSQDIVSHLMIYVWNKKVAWPDMESEADNMYYDYVVKRYQAFPNIIWDVSKEALHHKRATKAYVLERIARARRLDAYNRLVSVHDYGFCRNNADHVDFISMQNWKHTLYQHMLEARNEFPQKPIFNIEHGGYEESPYVVFPGAYANAEACLRRNYMCLFAGGYTTYYWQGASWNVVIHNPFEQPKDFIKPHFEYFKHMRKLFDTVHFENCKPLSRYNGSGYNLTNKKDGIVLMYVPKENQWVGANNVIENVFDHKHATKQWFNTLTGELTQAMKFEKKNLGFWEWRPWRGEADAILVIRNLESLKN